MLFILNFGHQLPQSVLDELAPATEIRVSLQIDFADDAEPTPVQVSRAVRHSVRLLHAAGGTLDGSTSIVLALPGLVEATALIIAEFCGRFGTLPRMLALRRQGHGGYALAKIDGIARRCRRCNGTGAVSGTACSACGGTGKVKTAPIGGILDLERVRQSARGRRFSP